jgi:protein CpxP
MKKVLILSTLLCLALPFSFISPAFSQSSPAPEQRREHLTEKLNLTESQKAQWQEIKRSSRERVEAILTPEQKAQAREQKTQGRGKNWRSLNLTDAQKEQIRAIKQETNQQIQAMLTPEQQQILAQMKKNRGENRRNR